MLEEKQGQFLESASNFAQNFESRFSSFFFFDDWRFSNKITISYLFLVQKKPEKKSKIGIRSFVRNSMQIPKLSLFFF